MYKSRILLVGVVLFFLNERLEATVCWKRPYCSCVGKNNVNISCTNVHNVSDVTGLFKNFTAIYKIRLRGWFTSITSRAFEGVSVSVLVIISPLDENIPQDSFFGVRNLKEVTLNETRFQRIPDVFSNQNYKVFHSIRGELTGLATQLQNMSSATEIVLSRNRITFVSEEAFQGSDVVRILDLSYNQLTYLHPDVFEPIKFLEDINLSHNHLYSVDGCFHDLNPKTLNLYGNNLTSIDKALHQGMWNLKYLNVGGNAKINVSSSTFNSGLKALLELHLSYNDFTSLDPSLLRNLWYLNFLYLNGNNLASLPPYFLDYTPSIMTLELSNNRLTTMKGVLDTRREWYRAMKLVLDGNELTTPSFGKSHMDIYSADMSRNRISHIAAADMVPLQKVTFLNLSRNGISSLERGCFNGFYSLVKLDLSENYLTNLNGTLQGLPKLYMVFIRSSSLESLPQDAFLEAQRLKIVVLRNNSLSTVQGTFRNMKYISSLDIAMNNLTTLTIESFPPFQKTSIRVTMLSMADNPWSCDCRLVWFAAWVRRQGSRLTDEPICSSPAHLRGLALRTLNRTDFENWMDDCPSTCECICRPDGERMYTEVRCLKSGLSEVPKVLPSNVRSIDLRGNVIESFDGRDVLNLEDLESLNLENNKIDKVRLVFPPKLTTLRLAFNNLRTFPLDEWIGNVSISLSRNPWICNCDTWQFRNWLVQHNESVVDVQAVRCGREESLFLRDRQIISLTRKDLCSSLTSIIIASTCCVLFLILCLICLCYRQSLAACLYSWGCTCLKKPQRHNYPYDAFLMYSEDDEQLALGELAKGLESGKHPFLLCIPARNIPSPRSPQKVNSYLAQCTKVIVLLTRKFIENRECIRLLISAMSFSTDSSSKCIIFITHGDMPRTSELDPVLKTLLRSCTRLRWGQCLFWQKLIYQLPKNINKKTEYDDDEEPLLGQQ